MRTFAICRLISKECGNEAVDAMINFTEKTFGGEQLFAIGECYRVRAAVKVSHGKSRDKRDATFVMR